MQAANDDNRQKLNGLDTEALAETVAALQADTDLARCEFRARTEWIDGGHTRTVIKDFYAAGQEDTSRDEPFVFDAGEPPVLLGNNEGANPVEYALKALASCLTTSMVFHATARGIELEGVRARLEGDLDIQGFLDLNENVRNGYEGIRVTFEIDGDFTDEQKEELCQLAQSRSPVFDIISNPVPVEVRVADA